LADKNNIATRYALFVHAKLHPTVLPGTFTVLRRIRATGRQLICWTRGDDEKQRTVLENSGLTKHFGTIIVPSVKDAATARTMLLPAINGAFAIIGDSYIADIEPVLDTAEAAFRITGSRANQIAGISHTIPDPRVTRLDGIADLVPLLPNLLA
jgi:hypothetical protein